MSCSSVGHYLYNSRGTINNLSLIIWRSFVQSLWCDQSSTRRTSRNAPAVSCLFTVTFVTNNQLDISPMFHHKSYNLCWRLPVNDSAILVWMVLVAKRCTRSTKKQSTCSSYSCISCKLSQGKFPRNPTNQWEVKDLRVCQVRLSKEWGLSR